MPLGLCYLFCRLLLRFSTSVGAVLCSLLGFLCLRVGALLAGGVSHSSWLRSLQSRLPFVVSPTSHVSVCPSPALAVGWLVTGLWPLLLLGSCGVCCAVLSPLALAHPTLLGLRLKFPLVSWSKLLEFSWTLYRGYFLSLPVVTVGSGWLLGHPWFSTLRCFAAGGVTLVFCRGHVGLPSGPAVPLGSSVLRGYWSSRWGHLSQVGPVVFLSP